MKEERILEYLKALCSGRSRAKKSPEIECALGISSNELRKYINRLRRKGIPIGSGRNGYFYAVTAGEVYATICQLRVMEQGLKGAIIGLECALNDFAANGGNV